MVGRSKAQRMRDYLSSVRAAQAPAEEIYTAERIRRKQRKRNRKNRILTRAARREQQENYDLPHWEVPPSDPVTYPTRDEIRWDSDIHALVDYPYSDVSEVFADRISNLTGLAWSSGYIQSKFRQGFAENPGAEYLDIAASLIREAGGLYPDIGPLSEEELESQILEIQCMLIDIFCDSDDAYKLLLY
jgi:hypothetical protein